MATFLRKMRYLGGVQGVVFDWAGTIVDYGCFSPAGVFLAVFKEEGVNVTVEEARVPMGIHKKIHIRQMLEMDGVLSRWVAAKGSKASANDVERLYQRFTPLQEQTVGQYATLVPGCLEAIERLRSGSVKIGTCTGFARSILDVLIEKAALQGFSADCNVAADEVIDSRPAPDMVLHNAMHMRVFPPAALVKVDDTSAGILEGINAGCWTIGVVETGNYVGLSEKDAASLDPAELRLKCDVAATKLREAGAHFVVDSVADVPDVVDEINSMLKCGVRP